MLRSLLSSLLLAWLTFKKTAAAFYEYVFIGNRVTLTLTHANGPLEGQVYKRMSVGRNIVTAFLSGSSPRSGRDIMRRLIIPSSFGDSLITDNGSTFSVIRLGSGTTAETSADTALDNAISGTDKTITAVSLDGTNPYVAFSVEYDETEANQAIAECSLETSNGDFVARKTFNSFTKTSDFRLTVEWEIRF